jgi:exodeoxyribonuclease VII small subunit
MAETLQADMSKPKDVSTQIDVSKMTFEDALAELEQIVRGLEGGQQKLEDAITAYERGAALRKHCESKLAEAEARVAAIVRSADGSITTRPLE